LSRARSLFRYAALVTGCAVAVGCSLIHPAGPDYHPPVPTNAALDASRGKAFAPESPPGPWWQLYRNSELDGYVAEALRENLDLRAAASRIEIMNSLVDEAKAARFPSTSVSASAERQRNWIDGSPFLMVYNAIGASLGVSYELDLSGRIRRSIESASASAEEQQFAFAATQIRVVADTVSAYVGVCQANAALVAAQQTVQIDTDSLAISQKLAKGGIAGQLDVTRARAQLEADEAQLPTIESQRQMALYALAVMLGRTPDRYPHEAVQCQVAPAIAQPLPVGDGLALLRRRPDVAESERALAAATANIGVATANLYPQVSIGASVGFSGSNLSNTFNAAGRTWSIGPALQWTFPNVAATEAQIHRAGASADLARSNYDKVVLNALKETESALNAYSKELERHATLQQARETSRVAFEQAKKLYLHGVVSYLDVLIAQKALAQAQEDLVNSAGVVSADQIAIFLALGGGWDDAAQRAADQARAAAESRQSGAGVDSNDMPERRGG
jgi:outer membrane protein, multidrug efflux system